MTAKCPTCNHPLKPTATARRAARKAAESDFEVGRCTHCGDQVLVGWTDAQLRHLDAHPLNLIGEMAAVALELPTFTRHGARFRLRGLIERARFPDRPNTVHPAHRCDRPWPRELLLPLAGSTRQQKNPEFSDRRIPF